MQVNRWFEIAYLLLRRDRVTADELAKRFGVSTRTIYRDLDALSAAGIPVYADRGRGGGIRLMEGFALNKAMLSDEEQSEVLAALQGMRATSAPEAESALNKLSLVFKKSPVGWVDVDFSSWSNRDTAFPLLKQAILERRRVAFTYYNRAGERSTREAEPLQLWFKHRSWYLKAYCTDKGGYRLFKYTRIQNLSITDARFERELPADSTFMMPGPGAPEVHLVMRIDASQAYRVYDEFVEGTVTRMPGGDFLAAVSYIEDSWLYGFILGFGPYAEVVAPERVRRIIARKIEKSFHRYEKLTRRCQDIRGILNAENDEGAMSMQPTKDTKFCQSCAMPMTDEMYGTEANGEKSGDYCKYCYDNGAFRTEETVEEMVESCIQYVRDQYPSEDAAREDLLRIYPQLKRWAQ